MDSFEAQIAEAYESLEAQGKRPCFILVGAAPSTANIVTSFFLFCRDHAIKPCGIVVDPFGKGSAFSFSPEALGLLSSDDYTVIDHPSEHPSPSPFENLKMLRTSARKLSKLENRDSFEDCSQCWDECLFVASTHGFVDRRIIDFAFGTGRPVAYVELEEGTGSYVCTPFERIMEWIDVIPDGKSRLFHSAGAHVGKPFLERLHKELTSKAFYVPFTLFNREPKGLSPNDMVCEYYKKAIGLLAKEQDIPTVDYSNTAIILTSKLDPFGLSDVESKAARKAANILERNGLKVLVRPHPLALGRDEPLLDGLEVDLNSRLPIESLIALSSRQPVLTAGFMSSAQINANLLWGIPSLSLEGLVHDDLAKRYNDDVRTHVFRDNLSSIKIAFDGFLDFPGDSEEFEKRVAGIRKNRT